MFVQSLIPSLSRRSSRPSRALSYRLLILALWILGAQLYAISGGAPALAQTTSTGVGPPDFSPLPPHVEFPDFGTIPWPIDCSDWPENPPDDGYLASIFGHRILSGNADFHRGIDLRCDPEGHTCCEIDGSVVCDRTQCANGNEIEGAPIRAIVSGTIHALNRNRNNNFIIRTTLPADDITIGDTQCDDLYVWYSHMRDTYSLNPETGLPWQVGEQVEEGTILGWQGKTGANTVHLHLSTRVCTNNRADEPDELDPEVNPFQLIGTDDGVAPVILFLDADWNGTELTVTVQIGTEDPDFDQLEITVYDAPNDTHHIRRLGYNNRNGIDVGGNIDTFSLQPNGLSVLTTVLEPDPPDPTSGFTLEARFPDFDLASDPNTRVQIKVADVFGNTSIQQIPVFGPDILSSAVLHLDSATGLTLDGSGHVERWADQSGYGNDAVQLQAGLQPLADGDGIYFDPGSAMCIPHSPELTASTLSAFLVVKPETEQEYAGVLTSLHLGERKGWNLVMRSHDLVPTYFVTSIQGDGTFAYQGNISGITIDTPHLLSMRHANPGSVIKVNGVSPGLGNAHQLISYATNGTLCLNDYYSDVSSPLLRADARFYEVVLFDSALSPADETIVGDYLMDKWGITSPRP